MDTLEIMTDETRCAEAIYQQLLQGAGEDPNVWIRQILRNCATELAPLCSEMAKRVLMLERQLATLNQEIKRTQKLARRRK